MVLSYTCKECGYCAPNNNGLISHVSQSHHLSSKAYYDLYMKSPNEGICPVCGKETAYKKLSKGYARCCSLSCASRYNAEERKQVRYQKYGDGNYFSTEGSKKLKAIAKNTSKSRFSNIIKNLKATYNIPDDKEITNISQIEEIKNKVCHTVKEKYGVPNSFLVKDDDNIERRIKTCLKLYGVPSPLQNSDVRDRVKNTCILKYGYTNPVKSPEVKAKIRNTCIHKYGVTTPMQNETIRAKAKAKYNYNGIRFDSSWEIAFYIYLVDHHIRFEYHPGSFNYYYPGDNKTHKYEYDFKLFDNTIVEIKGSHLLKKMQTDTNSKAYYKYMCMRNHNVHIITDVSKYINYVKINYGVSYLASFKTK